MDVMDFLRDKVDDSTVDCAVIDPPYNLHKARWDIFANQAAFMQFTREWLSLLLPKIKEGGSLYVFNTAFNAAHILCFLSVQGMVFQNWIVWDKRDGMTAPKRKYANGQETILFFTKKGEHTFNYDDIRVPYLPETLRRPKGVIKNGKRWFPNPAGKLCTDVWHFSSARHTQKENGKTKKTPHLTPKPPDMIRRIIKASSNPGDLVLDCFLGSGTTAVVCQETGRNFIGCEKDETYHHLCMQNIGP